jgi:hypothetical protein
MKKSSAEVKCLSLNTLYQYAKEFYEYEKAHFSQFIGKNIFKVDGSFKQKYEHDRMTAKGQLPDGTFYGVHYWFEYSYHTLKMRVKSCINGGTYDDKTYFCQYDDLTIYIFDTNDNNELQETQPDISYLDKRYNAEELTEISKQIELAALAYDLELSRMPHQFRQVFHLKRLSY